MVVNHIEVRVNKLSGFGIDRGSVSCKHGKILNANYLKNVTLDIDDTALWGPDCTMRLSPLTEGNLSITQDARIAKLHVQQNLCAFSRRR